MSAKSYAIAGAAALALAGCAIAPSSSSPREGLLEIPGPAELAGKTFEFDNRGPETAVLHARGGVLGRVLAGERVRITWRDGAYQVERLEP